MDQVTKVELSGTIDNFPYYNYELVVSSYQILNSLSNDQNQIFTINSKLRDLTSSKIKDKFQINQANTSKQQSCQSKVKSDSIINLINSDSNVSNWSQVSKPTSIQNNFRKIKHKIVIAQNKDEAVSVESQDNERKSQSFQSQKANSQKKSQKGKQEIQLVFCESEQIELKQKQRQKQNRSQRNMAFNNQRVYVNSQNMRCQYSNQNMLKPLQEKSYKYIIMSSNQVNTSSNLINMIPQFVIQQDNQKQSLNKSKYNQQPIVKHKIEDFVQIQNKLTTPSLNQKNYSIEDNVIWQEDYFANSQLEQDYIQFVYNELLTKNKENEQLRKKMQLLNQKMQKQQNFRLQLNFNNQKLEQDIKNIRLLQSNKFEMQILYLQQQRQYYKHTNDKLDRSVQQKQKQLFQYFINKQSKLDKIQNQNYCKILQLKSQLNFIQQKRQIGQDQAVLMENQRLKKIFQEERKKYLNLKAKNDSIQTGITYLKQKRQKLLGKTLAYLRCAKSSLQNVLNDQKNIVTLDDKKNINNQQ